MFSIVVKYISDLTSNFYIQIYNFVDFQTSSIHLFLSFFCLSFKNKLGKWRPMLSRPAGFNDTAYKIVGCLRGRKSIGKLYYRKGLSPIITWYDDRPSGRQQNCFMFSIVVKCISDLTSNFYVQIYNFVDLQTSSIVLSR